MNLLFWNLMKHENSCLLAECIKENKVDVAILSEKDGTDFRKVSELLSEHRVVVDPGGCKRICLVADKAISIEPLVGHSRYSISGLKLDAESFLLVGVHLQDRRSCPNNHERLEVIRELMQDIRRCEADCGHDNTIIIGDFNANPYDEELLLPNGFNAVLFKDVIVNRETMTWLGKEWKFMYNPIINWLGEDSKTYGSYYYVGTHPSSYWHCLDQVLVGRPLIDRVASLSYLRDAGKTSLIAKSAPDKKVSDHLPLFVTLSERADSDVCE